MYYFFLKDGAFLKSVYNWFYETSTNNMFMVEKDVEYNVLIEADHDAGYGPGDKMKFAPTRAAKGLSQLLPCS